MMRHGVLPWMMGTTLILTPVQAADMAVRYEASHEAMGTVFTVVAYGHEGNYLAEVVNEVFEEVDRLDDQMSNYKPESELSIINREAAQRDVIVEPRLFGLIQDSLRYSADTQGAFDVTVGPLMKLWGFFRGQGRVPSRAEITQVLKRVGYQHVRLNSSARTIRFDEAGMELDLGGIGKGYAVDQAVKILRSAGVTSALVSSGTSSIYALGSPPGIHGWKVTLRDPYDARKAGDVLHLQNYSLSTSGCYEKFFKIGGKTYCHIMNPRTGMPVEDMLSAAVLAPSTTESDALTKFFFVLRVNDCRRYLHTHPNLTVVLYQPAATPRRFNRVELRSDSYQFDADQFAEISE
jgi:thiamine biosynthesis lipoprotein